MNTDTVKNENILIVDRLKEIKNIYCGNRLDKLINNNCYHGEEDPYIAHCPINYNSTLVNNEYKCYKNCPEKFKNAEITSVDYNINKLGKQCLKKTFITQ